MPPGSKFLIGKLVNLMDGLSVISLKKSELECESCGGKCHEFLKIPKSLFYPGDIGYIRVIRCLNCIFWGPYYIYFKKEKAIKVVAQEYECHDFIDDQCDKSSKASIEWVSQESVNMSHSTTFYGETPIWLGADEWPTCPECSNEMKFVFQISSESIDASLLDIELSKPFEISIEYYATLYFFICKQCNITCSITQND